MPHQDTTTKICHTNNYTRQQQQHASSTTTHDNDDVLCQWRGMTTTGQEREAKWGFETQHDASRASGKLFIYFFINLILNLYYRLLQVLLTMHDDNVPCQGRHTTTTTSYIKEDIQRQRRATSRTTHNSGVPCQ